MSHHFQSPQVIENVSKEEIAFSLCDEKNSMEGIFRDPQYAVGEMLTRIFHQNAQNVGFLP